MSYCCERYALFHHASVRKQSQYQTSIDIGHEEMNEATKVF